MTKEHHTPGGVHVQVKGKNIAVSPELRAQVTSKMGKLDKYLDRLDAIEVELHTEKTRDTHNHSCVAATAHVLGRTIRVTATEREMRAAIDVAVDKLYRQLNRKKERIKAHHAPPLAEAVPILAGNGSVAGEPLTPVEVPGDSENGLVHVKRVELKPGFEEDAIEEMEAAGYDFHVFLNARNEQINVLYRRSDGTYGLIEPRVG